MKHSNFYLRNASFRQAALWSDNGHVSAGGEGDNRFPRFTYASIRDNRYLLDCPGRRITDTDCLSPQAKQGTSKAMYSELWENFNFTISNR